MYERFFGLRERPFELTPNPHYLFMTPSHREALATLQYGIAARRGMIALVGEAGTGKTTIIRAALQRRGVDRPQTVVLNNPTMTRDEFLEYLAHGFGLVPAAAASKARLLIELTRVLMDRRHAGEGTALVVDEAHCLPDELLEEVRLLANIETAREKLLSVVLAGQPELTSRLNHPGLRQLKQRIALRAVLEPLTPAETRAYVTGRVRIAGGHRELFTADAVTLIHERSRGIPRTISVLCDNALVTAFAEGLAAVDVRVVRDVCRDFDLGRPAEVTPIAADWAVSARAAGAES